MTLTRLPRALLADKIATDILPCAVTFESACCLLVGNVPGSAQPQCHVDPSQWLDGPDPFELVVGGGHPCHQTLCLVRTVQAAGY